jgi:glutamate-1-semialdehyde 2,1-aminomutase
VTREIPFAGLPDDEWRSRAAGVIPGGSSTGSRRPDVLYGSRAFDHAVPTHYERAEGCYLWSPDGRRFLDCGMALGAVGIGYADAAVTRAVIAAASSGNVSALPHRLEVEVAERLVQVIPSAEQVRFLRTGAEANAAAIRLARALTGRERIIACGYFGWLDWCSDAAGVPASVQRAVSWVPFNDIAALDRAVLDGDTPPAAIIIEPLVHDIANVSWLESARRHADRSGAVLIFDEVKTAFRVRTGGVQELTGVIPDLTTLGKAMANAAPSWMPRSVPGSPRRRRRKAPDSQPPRRCSTGMNGRTFLNAWRPRVECCRRSFVPRSPRRRGSACAPTGRR